MTVFDLHTPDVSDDEELCSPNEYEPVVCKRYSGTDTPPQRKSTRSSHRSSTHSGSHDNCSATQVNIAVVKPEGSIAVETLAKRLE